MTSSDVSLNKYKFNIVHSFDTIFPANPEMVHSTNFLGYDGVQQLIMQWHVNLGRISDLTDQSHTQPYGRSAQLGTINST